MICPSCRATNDDAADMCFNCGRGLSGLTRGSVIAGRYEIRELLGRGGMGLVYKAQDRELDELVVLKLLRADLARAEGMARRFRSEIKLARRIRHPNVCAIHEFGQDGEFCFITMELVDGVDLKREIRQRGALPAPDAFDVALQLAAGLQAIHDGGIVHRDLKTANIMRDRAGRVRLMDFGIAKQMHSESTGVTMTGQVIGTPEYMSPEQALGTEVDYRSDVYALGVVFFEIFTGRVPFQGETPIATLRKQVNDPPPLDGAEAAGLPGTMVAVLARALAKEPDARYASAAELREAVEWARAASPGEATVRIPARVPGATAPALTPAPFARPRTGHATPVPGRVPTAVGSAVATAVVPAVPRRRAAWWGAGLGAGAVRAAAVVAVATRPQAPVTQSPSPEPTLPPATLA
ncbi:MAG TPA: protein kinase, partial [Vicinamibacteria bacterium]|nr:protein kinase [Vicinamibacteria bacterium]